jgi:EAL domain-containing protein (putative c-di-GMP-specific phosphodiesterase class I)
MLTTFADDSIVLQYQPLASCHGEVAGFEALMRWHHRQRGSISPEAFIPVFESSGLMVPLSRWALRRACLDAVEWEHPLSVSVNVSAVQLRDDDLPGLVRAVLAETGLPAARLELELSETALLADPDRAGDVLHRLAGLGIVVVLDDFGVAGTSPASVRDFPFAKIKIDGALIGAMDQSPRARSVVKMIIELTHSLDRIVVAEGVETATQLAYLEAEGCDMVQGFLFGHPAPIAEFERLTGSHAPCRAAAEDSARRPVDAFEAGAARPRENQHAHA